MLLGLLSSLVFRAVRDALPNNPAAQERILGATLTAMAIADVSLPILISMLSARCHFAALTPGPSVSQATQ